jgi:hypothetical protein
LSQAGRRRIGTLSEREFLVAGVALYAGEGANLFWSELTAVPVEQFHRPYRAMADHTRHASKHPLGCPSLFYACSRTHRTIMGLYHALLSSDAIPG